MLAWNDSSVRAADKIKRLRAEVAAAQGYRAAAEEIATRRGEMVDALTAERDEARRIACQLEVNWNFVCSEVNKTKFRKLTLDPKAVAVERGWDCFDAKEAKP